MTQRSIEILIGRLVTDEAFRHAFLEDPDAAIEAFAESGHELSAVEIAAVTAVAQDFWAHAATEIDPRLQKASLSTLKQ